MPFLARGGLAGGGELEGAHRVDALKRELGAAARGERLLASCTLCECVSRRSEAAQWREAVVLRRRTSMARVPIAREAEWSRGTVCEYV